MSEVSMLSAQFRVMSKTVDQINHAVMVLKAQMVNSEQGDQGKDMLDLEKGELEHAADFIKNFIERVFLLENPGNSNVQPLPIAAASQLTSTVIADTPDFFVKLRVIESAIQNQQILNLPQLDLLDQTIEALDQERSELFKKLRAARG